MNPRLAEALLPLLLLLALDGGCLLPDRLRGRTIRMDVMEYDVQPCPAGRRLKMHPNRAWIHYRGMSLNEGRPHEGRAQPTLLSRLFEVKSNVHPRG